MPRQQKTTPSGRLRREIDAPASFSPAASTRSHKPEVQIMKSITRRMLMSAGIALIISLLAATDRSAAQERGDEKLISLDFPGGTAVAYVNAVRRAAGDVNVVVAPEASEIVMPEVSIKQVSVGSAIWLLNNRSSEQPGRQVKLEVSQTPMRSPSERPTYQIIAHVEGWRKVQAASVWTVAALLDSGISSSAVLSAVEVALQVVGSNTKPDVRFHEDTALLIASGDNDQLKAIEQVLDRLEEGVNRKRDEEMRRFEMELHQIDQDRQQIRKHLEEAQAEAQQARADNTALVQENARLEMLVNEHRRMLEEKERELTSVTADVRALQLELKQERSRREPGRSDSDR
jgi:hypothetical protein